LNCILKGSCTGSEMYRSRDWPRNISTRMCFACPVCKKGFGIVFLEAMAAGKPIVPCGPGPSRRWYVTEFWWNLKALRQSPMGLFASIATHAFAVSLASANWRDVEQFDVRRVARLFLSEVTKVAPGIAAGSRTCEPIQNRQSEELV